MERYGFIYIWRDARGNGGRNVKYYIGAHWGNINDGYISSSVKMKDEYKLRPNDFKRRIIKIFDNRTKMFIEEQRFLSMIKQDELGIKYYNKCVDWKHWSSEEKKIEYIKKINSNITKNLHNDPNWRQKYEKGLETRITTNWKDPKERARKISEGKKKAFQKKREQGLPCFNGQAAENLKNANIAKRGKKLNLSPERIQQLKKVKRDPNTGKFIS